MHAFITKIMALKGKRDAPSRPMFMLMNENALNGLILFEICAAFGYNARLSEFSDRF